MTDGHNQSAQEQNASSSIENHYHYSKLAIGSMELLRCPCPLCAFQHVSVQSVHQAKKKKKSLLAPFVSGQTSTWCSTHREKTWFWPAALRYTVLVSLAVHFPRNLYLSGMHGG